VLDLLQGFGLLGRDLRKAAERRIMECERRAR